MFWKLIKLLVIVGAVLALARFAIEVTRAGRDVMRPLTSAVERVLPE